MFCPFCGIANPPRATRCTACRSSLDLFAPNAPGLAADTCPRCGGATPPLATGRAVYCMQCGKPLRPAPAVIPATPDPDLCPLCHEKAAAVKTLFHEPTADLARELAPPRKPLALWLFGAPAGQTGVAASKAATRGRRRLPSLLASATASVYTLAIWTLGALALVLLLLAMSKVGSYKELPAVVEHGQSIGAVISARVAASLPFLLGALASLAIALGLLAIKGTFDKLRSDTVIAYQRALKNWQAAYYCPTDRIVFIRAVSAVTWEPVEELRRLLAGDGPAGPGA